MVESEIEDRQRKKRALQAQINEKRSELDRSVMTTTCSFNQPTLTIDAATAH